MDGDDRPRSGEGVGLDLQPPDADERQLEGEGEPLGGADARSQARVGSWANADEYGCQFVLRGALAGQEAVHGRQKLAGVLAAAVPGELRQQTPLAR